jgi:large subunit ribosomal protein L22
METRAVAKYIGISSKKMRLVAKEVKGKDVAEALDWLRLLPSPSAKALAKVIKSAAANAENNFQMLPSLRINQILIDEGSRLKRFRAQARGRASPILKHSCHITVIVEEK